MAMKTILQSQPVFLSYCMQTTVIMLAVFGVLIGELASIRLAEKTALGLLLMISSLKAYLCTGYPRKDATDLNNSKRSCFILVSKKLFLLKSAIIRMNFDIFSSIFGDLVVKLEISKVQDCFHVKTRAATLAIVD